MAKGDKNTKFFHAKSSLRRKKNTILGIEDNRRSWQTKDARMEEIICQYFEEILTSTNPSLHDMEKALSCVEAKVIYDMNNKLTAPFSEQEIRSVLFQLNPSKALGLDNFSGLFFFKNFGFHWFFFHQVLF